MDTFSVPRRRTLSVLYYAYALWLMLRLIQHGVVYTGTRTGNPYWPIRSIGRKGCQWICMTLPYQSHPSYICRASMVPDLTWYYSNLKYVNSRFCYVILPVVRARASSIQMANIFCRPKNHDYGMTINLIIVIMSYTSVAHGRSVVSLLAIFHFWFFFLGLYTVAFVLRSTVIPDVRITDRTLYSKLTSSYIHVP